MTFPDIDDEHIRLYIDVNVSNNINFGLSCPLLFICYAIWSLSVIIFVVKKTGNTQDLSEQFLTFAYTFLQFIEDEFCGSLLERSSRGGEYKNLKIFLLPIGKFSQRDHLLYIRLREISNLFFLLYNLLYKELISDQVFIHSPVFEQIESFFERNAVAFVDIDIMFANGQGQASHP